MATEILAHLLVVYVLCNPENGVCVLSGDGREGLLIFTTREKAEAAIEPLKLSFKEAEMVPLTMLPGFPVKEFWLDGHLDDGDLVYGLVENTPEGVIMQKGPAKRTIH